jgi:ribosome biogenesis protein BRX1
MFSEQRNTQNANPQTFGTPRNHPKSKPFYDHVMSFYYQDKKIWYRHYQIQPLTETDNDNPEKQTLTEVGPRFVLDPIRIMDKSFTGQSLFVNGNYASPTEKRRQLRAEKGIVARGKEKHKEKREERREGMKQDEDATMSMFHK